MSAQTQALDNAMAMLEDGISAHVAALVAARDQSQNALYIEATTARVTQLTAVLAASKASN